MQIPYAKFGIRSGPRAVLIACSIAWLAVAAALVALPTDISGRGVVVTLVFCAAGAFAVGASGYVAYTAASWERIFWGLLGAGILARLGGYLTLLAGSPGPPQGETATQALYGVSYALLFAAMVYLASLAARRLAWITALDAAAVVLSFETLVWFFTVGPPPSGIPGSIGFLSRPALDAGILYSSLVILSAPRRPPWANFLAPGFLALMLACLAHLGGANLLGIGGSGWPELFGALGVALLGCGAVYASFQEAGFEREQSIAPWRVFSFWFGPLSPAVHLGILLVWGAYGPPLPAYVLAACAGLMVYFALRISLVSYISERSGQEKVKATRRNEQDRLLQELHETVKQGVHGVSLTLDSASEAARLGESSVARERISRARETIRGTEYLVSRPYDELRSRQHEDTLDEDSTARESFQPESFLCYRLSRFEEYFGIKAHADLRSPLEDLSPEELEAVNRIAAEAFWNVAKHSRARNLYLESRRVGRVLIVRIRDDGRGFDTTEPSSGMGLLLMRRRAREVSADLDVISKPAVGTTVQLRVHRKSL